MRIAKSKKQEHDRQSKAVKETIDRNRAKWKAVAITEKKARQDAARKTWLDKEAITETEFDTSLYCDPRELEKELHAFHVSGIISNRLGELLLAIAKGYSRRFSSANQDWLDDVVSAAWIRLSEAIKSLHASSGSNCFCYLTSVVRNEILHSFRGMKNYQRTLQRYGEHLTDIGEIELWSLD